MDSIAQPVNSQDSDSSPDSSSGDDESSEMYEIPVPDGLELNPGDTLTVKSVADGMAQVECEHAGEQDSDDEDDGSFDSYKKKMLDYMSPQTDGENQQAPTP